MIHFRIATAGDLDNVIDLHVRSWRENYRGILSDQFLDDELERDRGEVWQKRFHDPPKNQQIIIADYNEAMAGFACIYIDDDHELGTLIDNLHVTRLLKNQGIGRSLMQAVAQFVKANARIPKMYLWVYKQNKNARIFYERIEGTLYDTVQKETVDSSYADICRYVWHDLNL